MMMDTLDNCHLQGFQTQKYLVIATKWLNPVETKAIFEYLFNAAWGFGIIEINCLIYATNSSWSLVTYHPYDNEDCTTFTYKTIATFASTNYSLLANIPIRTLYARKMINMRKCPITIAVVPSEPYVFTTTKKGQKTFDGIEIRLIKAIASSLNFTPNLILPHDIDDNLYPNATKRDCLEMVCFTIE